MALPPADKLRDLAAIYARDAPKASQFEPFSETKAKLAKYAKMAAVTAVQTGIQSGLTIASGAPTVAIVHVGVGTISLFPLGAAIGPWIAAAVIASRASGIFALHDLKASASGSGDGAYSCSCGNCVKNLAYVIDRKETNTAIFAVGVFTAGLAIIGDRINSIRKSFQKNRPKEQICKSLVEGARGGCICAIGTIMMICGGWKDDAKKDGELTLETTAIVWSSDGHAKLKSKW